MHPLLCYVLSFASSCELHLPRSCFSHPCLFPISSHPMGDINEGLELSTSASQPQRLGLIFVHLLAASLTNPQQVREVLSGEVISHLGEGLKTPRSSLYTPSSSYNLPRYNHPRPEKPMLLIPSIPLGSDITPNVQTYTSLRRYEHVQHYDNSRSVMDTLSL